MRLHTETPRRGCNGRPGRSEDRTDHGESSTLCVGGATAEGCKEAKGHPSIGVGFQEKGVWAPLSPLTSHLKDEGCCPLAPSRCFLIHRDRQ